MQGGVPTEGTRQTSYSVQGCGWAEGSSLKLGWQLCTSSVHCKDGPEHGKTGQQPRFTRPPQKNREAQKPAVCPLHLGRERWGVAESPPPECLWVVVSSEKEAVWVNHK